ncbi:MAG: acyl-CoA dehydrogenase [Proteobacteria bacterium]|nr:acyl-CoA dehydrogenase [Pseudomonadota bacterium]
MSLDLDFDDGQQAIADAVNQFCRERCPPEVAREARARGALPLELWRELAATGFLAAAADDGGALEAVAVLEALGRAAFPGPLPETLLASRVLLDDERAAVVEGRAIAAVGHAGSTLVPWAPVADLFLWVERGRVFRARATGSVEPVETLGGEPWGRVALERGEELGAEPGVLALFDVALAALMAAAGGQLVEDAVEHARTRTQFGRPIGEFQAVAHPLADCHMHLAASRTLVRAAAWHFDEDSAEAGVRASAARLSARAASLEAAHVAHQTFGALGITLEGPVFHVSRFVRQLASRSLGDAGETVLAHFSSASRSERAEAQKGAQP